jgi:phosphoribosylformylglycinamidine cyclo-ligase
VGLTYKDSGVDIDKGEALVEKIKSKVKATYNDRVKSGVGGFACLYEVGDRLLAAGTDGVGTKLKLAGDCGVHNTVGIDLVAMCVNDILCTGAKPLFFMDYLATGHLDLRVSEDILSGIVEGCLQSECALIGGETAEMPGMYSDGEYDLAGFSVGEVFEKDILGGSRVKAGHKLLGLASDGFHSNGYSLLRKVLEDESVETKKEFLTPTKIYWSAVKELLKNDLVTGMSHITGGGLSNIARMNPEVGFNISIGQDEWCSKIFNDQFRFVMQKGDIAFDEMMRTFNGGVGLVVAVNNEDGNLSKVKEHFDSLGTKFFEIGEVTEDHPGEVHLDSFSFS